MKVLLVSSYRSKGGAARAASRLAEALAGAGVDVEYKSIYPKQMNTWQRLYYLARVAYDRVPALVVAGKRSMFSSGALPNNRLITSINESDADLVHLHWINGGGLSVDDLKLIHKPIVWTLHDMWGFTGGCHYDAGCNGFLSGCGRCPMLKSDNPTDLSAMGVEQKASAYALSENLTIVGLSKWMVDSAARSFAMRGLAIKQLPNPIDVDVFRPGNRLLARARLGISPDTRLVAFGAVAAIGDDRKGFRQLIAALRLLNQQGHSNIELAIFGGSSSQHSLETHYKAHYFGHISCDEQLRDVYSAADVMVVPSLQEAFGQTATEAMACGTPVVAFSATGLIDIVDHKRNGYLATPFNVSSLAEGIMWVLDAEHSDQLRNQARSKAVSQFANERVALDYLALYKSCVSQTDPIPAPIDVQMDMPLKRAIE
ncbi:glycosyltransferase family 4 protein [Stutzerimonas chloritidismutans]|uniref:glycosyltransferase family 4 protein n=1 Tax=Stutzerimonas chloritidismutans TaxID=203192 RepID=UPI00384B34EF